MRKIPVPLYILLLAGSTFPAFGASKNLPVVEILGKKYYVYVTKKGDTLFGVARDNKWDDAELTRLNSQVVSPLKKGVKLYYPVNTGEIGDIDPGQLSGSPVTELTHIVSKGESVYSIAQLYNIPVSEIYANNPETKNGVRKGNQIILRKSADKPLLSASPGNPGFHTIKEDESVAGIAKKYNVSVASLMAANPGWDPRMIKSGTILKLPEKGAGLKEVRKNVETPYLQNFDSYTVQKKDTWETISEKTGVDATMLAEVNPNVKTLKNKQTITVPKISTVNEEKTVVERDDRETTDIGVQSIYKDVHKVADNDGEKVNVRIAILAENPAIKKDSEFIKGFLTGVDKIKNGNLKVSIKIIDGTEKSEQVKEQISLFKPNLVFFTGDKSLPEYLLEYAESTLTPVVNTFDVKSEDYIHNPYIIQLLTPSQVFNENIAGNVYSRFGDHKLVIVGEEDSTDQLAAELRKLWNPKRIKYIPTGNIDVESFAGKDKYLFYSYSVKKADIEKLLENVKEIIDISPLSDVVTLGRPNWVLYDDALSESLHKANAFIPSRFYLDNNSVEAKSFNLAYKNLFNKTPAKSLPLYAAVGYDVAVYFIPEMATYSNDLNKLKASTGTVQSKIDLKRVSNWSGFINPPVYLVNFTPSETVEKIVIE